MADGCLLVRHANEFNGRFPISLYELFPLLEPIASFSTAEELYAVQNRKVLEFCLQYHLIQLDGKCCPNTTLKNCRGGIVYFSKDASRRGGYMLKCSKCASRWSPYKNTWFGSHKVSIKMEILLTYMWIYKFTNELIVVQTKCSKETVGDFKNFCRDVCAEYLIEIGSTMIGGVGLTVAVDESMFFKRKYHRGCRKRNQCWVLGGICRDTGEAFMVVVADRKSHTLIHFLKTYIRTGSTVITDCWTGYQNLVDECGFEYHFKVNHSIEFVSSENSLHHTNTIEGMWKHAKRSLPMTGTNFNLLAGYLAEFCYRKKYGNSSEDLFFLFLQHVSAMFPGVDNLANYAEF